MFTTIGRGARHALGSKLAVAVVTGALGFGVAGTAAYASIPDGNDVINACVSGTGSLRVINPAPPSTPNKCFSTETPLSWNTKGTPGPPGSPGAPGPPGRTGPPGTSSKLTFYQKRGTNFVGCDGLDVATGGGATAGQGTDGRFGRLNQSVPDIFGLGAGHAGGWDGTSDNGAGTSVVVLCVHQQ